MGEVSGRFGDSNEWDDWDLFDQITGGTKILSHRSYTSHKSYDEPAAQENDLPKTG